ncbi:MAG: hypothetical protein MJ252_25475 [archaeon]|nr:hypothetical protein [archaeon]
MEFTFKKEFPDPKDRIAEWGQILTDYPDYIPIICEKDPKSKSAELTKKKYIVPPTLTVSQFGMLIRKKLKATQDEALFFLINGEKAISGSAIMSEIYDVYKDKSDGILYIMYSTEVLWG